MEDEFHTYYIFMTKGIIAMVTRYNSRMADRTVTLPFGRALRIRREKERLTQGGLADRMGGQVDQSTVSKWEIRAEPMRDYELLHALARALNTPVEDIIEGRVPAEWVGLQDEPQDELTQQLENQSRLGRLSEEEIEVLEGFRDLIKVAQEHVRNQIKLLRNGHNRADTPHDTDAPHERLGGA